MFASVLLVTLEQAVVVAAINDTKNEVVPGFGALISLLALCIIAFVIPRFRKEKQT
ncbi:MAG: hypothetical protein ACXAD7_14565 [Candidatus Kariarchaeaceae archaeon]